MMRLTVVTGSRAEYGQLHPVIDLMDKDPEITMELIVTGSHLDQSRGYTINEVKQDRWRIHKEIDINCAETDAGSISSSYAKALTLFSDLFSEGKSGSILLLGDRYEIHAVALAAYFSKNKIFHLCGGDSTKGAMDDVFRHGISLMADYHFPTNAQSAEKLKNLGIDPHNIMVTGNPALDRLKNRRKLSKADIYACSGIEFGKRNWLVAYHPETLDDQPVRARFSVILRALESVSQEDKIIFTFANQDIGGNEINEMIREFAKKMPNAYVFPSLGSELFHNVLERCTAIIGNSSGGITEAPSLGVATINIGNRQSGRLLASSVYSTGYDHEKIIQCMKNVEQRHEFDVRNPYGDGDAARRIVEGVKKYLSGNNRAGDLAGLGASNEHV